MTGAAGAAGAEGSEGVAGGRLKGRLIGLGVTGSIAAFKAVELLRLLSAEGADVSVMMTPAATRFVGPLTFAALSRHPVETDLLELLPDERIGHIVIADAADAIVVAPATAHWLGAMANGLAADVVTATVLASSAPVVVAPAMDGDMWTHPATQANVARLRHRGPCRWRTRVRPVGYGPPRGPVRDRRRHRGCRRPSTRARTAGRGPPARRQHRA